ncbi:hypothetical protein [Nocardioides sp.]|uniref:hypothetical protein n=1 Tax=Nocardioides sp. TaxID=35761 RepID=UPI00262E4D7C|nr:hypothetical protein [Nocardioides sp.]
MAAAESWGRLLASACMRSGTPGAVLGVWHDGSRTVVPHGVLNTRPGVETIEDFVLERRAVRLEVFEDASGLGVHIRPTGDFVLGTPETVRLVPCDSSGDRHVARSEEGDPWTPFTFSTLPDGTPQLFFSSRVAPLVSRRPQVER